MDAEQIRIFGVLLDEAREQHKLILTLEGEGWVNHSSIDEDGQFDVACDTCPHINEAEYALALAQDPTYNDPH